MCLSRGVEKERNNRQQVTGRAWFDVQPGVCHSGGGISFVACPHTHPLRDGAPSLLLIETPPKIVGGGEEP